MKRSLNFIFLGGVAFLFAYVGFKYSLYLAASRIYHVDECQNVFTARLLATGQGGEYFTSVSLFLTPLIWLARDAAQSVDLFASARLVSFLIFWLNLLLIALATGEMLVSRRFLIALIGACTLAPLWDYGLEVRHDNLLLTGLLLTWCVVRGGRGGLPSYVFSGAIAAALQFTAFKAFVYTAPLTLAILIFPPTGNRVPRWKLMLAWVAGALAMFLIVRFAYGAAGIWEAYLAGFRWVSKVSTGDKRFPPWTTLARLLTQTPLLLALLVAAMIDVVAVLRRQGWPAVTWDGNLPEAALFLVALAAIVINPAPYPYNLLNFVPFAYIFCFRFAGKFGEELWKSQPTRPLLVTILIFAHLTPFTIATYRHSNWSNFRQENLMRMAESLTDRDKDLVYDGVGLVPTRASIHYKWYIQALDLDSFRKEGGPEVREMLAASPATVIIPNYRTDWLPEADHEYIRAHYVPLGDDFWVLGNKLPRSGGSFEIIHPGRYQISQLKRSNILGTYPESLDELMKAAASKKEEVPFVGTLDGSAVPNRPIELTVGTHRVESAVDDEVAVVWVGPKLDQVPQIGRGDHQRLFDNWY